MNSSAAQTWWLTQRLLKAVVRQPVFLVVNLVQPVIWLFLFGSLFRKVVDLPGFSSGSYIDYLVPGVVIMSALSTSMWAGMDVLGEIERGTLNRFLVSPVSRAALMNANIVQHGITTAVQSLLIVVLGLVGGARYAGGVPGIVVLVAAAVLLGTVCGAASNSIGMVVRQRQTIIALNTFLLLPLTFVSSAFMDRDLMPHWMTIAMAVNPVDWALRAGRGALGSAPDWETVLGHGGALLALAVGAAWLSTRALRTYQKSI